MLTNVSNDGGCLPATIPGNRHDSRVPEPIAAKSCGIEASLTRFTDPRIQIVLDFVDSAPSEAVSIESAAAVVYLSPSRFRHLFKEQMGISFHSYLIRLRLERVRYLLQSSRLTILQIAEQLDVQDLSHLMRDFKRTYGMSPGALRKLHAQNSSPVA